MIFFRKPVPTLGSLSEGRLFRDHALTDDRLRPAVGADKDVAENAFGDLDVIEADAAARPALDFHGDRRGADLLDGAVATDFVADQDRAVKHHGGDGDRDDAAAGIAMVRIAGSLVGGTSGKGSGIRIARGFYLVRKLTLKSGRAQAGAQN